MTPRTFTPRAAGTIASVEELDPQIRFTLAGYRARRVARERSLDARQREASGGG
jgi:hypothetical protein